MYNAVKKVQEFHERIGDMISKLPSLLHCDPESANQAAIEIRETLSKCSRIAGAEDTLIFRVCLALEELAEWIEAHAADDLVAAGDAWGDRAYCLFGDAVATGLPVDAIFEEVHRSNMTKTEAKLDSMGKATKRNGFQHPRISELLSHHRDGNEMSKE